VFLEGESGKVVVYVSEVVWQLGAITFGEKRRSEALELQPSTLYKVADTPELQRPRYNTGGFADIGQKSKRVEGEKDTRVAVRRARDRQGGPTSG